MKKPHLYRWVGRRFGTEWDKAPNWIQSQQASTRGGTGKREATKKKDFHREKIKKPDELGGEEPRYLKET